MALKIHSEKAVENTRRWIIEKGFNPEYLDGEKAPETFEEIALAILADFERATANYNYPVNRDSRFADWCQGLPGILDTGAWLLGCTAAIDFVGDLLEETEEEKARYTESQAERLAAALVLKALEKGVRKANIRKYKGV